MQILESQWLKSRLERISDEELFPMLDVGSSTLEYRTREQPWIEENVFAPLAGRVGRVWHADLKSGPGIDLTGDLLDPAFVSRLAALQPRSATLFNVLLHVRDPAAVCRAVQRIVRPGGFVFVSGAYRYPWTNDPFDNCFRPEIDAVVELFEGAERIDAAILDSGNWRRWDARERGGRSLPRMLARLCVPFYRPTRWLEVAHHAPYVFKHIQAFAVVLRLPCEAPVPTRPAKASGAGDVGLVVIGRNEGDRLQRCLASVAGRFAAAVYVDSGSTDGSVALARSLGLVVHELDPSTPFTAARARNEGFARLRELRPDLAFVQLLDGDCELDAAWVDRALATFDREPAAAIVCGRRRERAPETSVYNLLCDLEWNTPLGRDSDCGGDALVRFPAFHRAGGFDPALVAGEEHDLCRRLRRMGFAVLRIDADMTRHDAAMTRFGQFWRRAVRTGYAAAEGFAREGRREGSGHLRRAARAIVWGGIVPAVGLGVLLLPGTLVPPIAKAGLLGLLALGYAGLYARIARHRRSRGDGPRESRVYGIFCLLGKAPELQGVLRYLLHRARRRSSRWIEYKDLPGKTRREADCGRSA